MTSSDFAKELKKGLCGGYLFCGEEAYLRNYYLSEIKRSVYSDGEVNEVSGEQKTFAAGDVDGVLQFLRV